jgi:hypothetical protein
MAVTTEYRTGVASVLWAGRALENAVESGDDVETQAAIAELLRAAEARESAGTVPGFTPSFSATDEALPQSGEEALAQVLAELDVGHALLTAGSVAGEGTAPAPAQLTDALDDLEATSQVLAGPAGPATLGFGTAPEPPAGPPLDVLREQVPKTIDVIVTRTVGLGRDVVGGLALVPASAVQPALAAVASVVPDTGSVVRAALRAIRRAIAALEDLVPESIREQIRQWAADWWENKADPFLDKLVRRLLSVELLTTAAEAALGRGGGTDDALRTGYERLVELDARHGRVAELLGKIVRVLTKLVGPLAALFGAVAAWLYSIGAAGYLLALGAGVWVGRDHLDTGALVERVPGARTIIEEATA